MGSPTGPQRRTVAMTAGIRSQHCGWSPTPDPGSGPDLRLLGSVAPTIPDDEVITQYGRTQGRRLVEAPRHAPGRLAAVPRSRSGAAAPSSR